MERLGFIHTDRGGGTRPLASRGRRAEVEPPLLLSFEVKENGQLQIIVEEIVIIRFQDA